MLTACGQQNKNETTMDLTDDVQVALADSGRIAKAKVAILCNYEFRECHVVYFLPCYRGQKGGQGQLAMSRRA